MKSIKEKAQEWVDVYPSCGMADKSFQAGANYAISKAIEWLNDFCNEHYIMSYSDSHEVEINELIDIFKKKMEK